MRYSARYPVLMSIAFVLGGCANVGLDPAPPPAGAATSEWTVTTRPDMDLWYHGLAYTGLGADGDAPIYQPGYVPAVVSAKQVAGVFPTVLDQRAAEFAQEFAADERFSILQFLPLYFATSDAFFAALNAWIQADGNPQAVSDPARAQAVAFIAEQLPTTAQRRTIASWLEVLAEEDRVFFEDYRQGLATSDFAGVTRSVQSAWDGLVPNLQPFLDYVMLSGGELILSVPIGSEGRTVALGRNSNRVATGMPDPATPSHAVWAFIHELMYPFVGPIIEDEIAPADLRELDREALARRTAIRAGAILIEKVAPAESAEYRSAYMDWAGESGSFEAAFPIPADLAAALEDRITTVLSGF